VPMEVHVVTVKGVAALTVSLDSSVNRVSESHPYRSGEGTY